MQVPRVPLHAYLAATDWIRPILLCALLGVGAVGPVQAYASSSVSIVDNGFSSAALVVDVGDTVTWSNTGKRAHTTTSDTGAWNSGSLGPGGTFAFTFDAPGTFAYHCAFHEEMHGTITVQAAAATPTVRPTAAPPSPVPPSPTSVTVATPVPAPTPAPVVVATRNPVTVATPGGVPSTTGGVIASAVIDPLLGGALSSPTGNVVVVFPGGALPSANNVSLMQAPSGTAARVPDGFRLSTTLVQLAAQDAAGLSAAGFAQPATLTVNPAESDLAAVGGDSSNLTLAQLNADSGTWDILQTAVNDDGSLTAAIAVPGLFAVLEAVN